MTQQSSEDYGKVTFADEVVAIIAGLAAMEIEGVAAMSGGIAGGIVEKLGRKTWQKVLKLKLEKKKLRSIFYNSRLWHQNSRISWNVQENVKRLLRI